RKPADKSHPASSAGKQASAGKQTAKESGKDQRREQATGRSRNNEATRSGQKTPAVRKKAALNRLPVTEQREKLALKFAGQHHPELAALLNGLRETDQTHYENAVREVARDADRIGKLEQRQDGRFTPSLRMWKLDSRIRLEAARFSMNQSPETEAELRNLMLDRQTARLRFLQSERQRLRSRLKGLNEQITVASGNPEGAVNAELNRLRKILAAKGRNRLQSTKPRRIKTTDTDPVIQNASATKVKLTRKPATVRPARLVPESKSD
ncbi:MAG: hypothetical protein VB858_10275, partial [Planctomycetaceae bacterium]